MALLDEASSQQDEVIYGQLVRGSYEKATVPSPPLSNAGTLSDQRHPRPAPENIQMLSLVLQNDSSIDHNRYPHCPFPHHLKYRITSNKFSIEYNYMFFADV
jgi:hypothetical protein